jgi:hypothetical protein
LIVIFIDKNEENVNIYVDLCAFLKLP